MLPGPGSALASRTSAPGLLVHTVYRTATWCDHTILPAQVGERVTLAAILACPQDPPEDVITLASVGPTRGGALERRGKSVAQAHGNSIGSTITHAKTTRDKFSILGHVYPVRAPS